MKKLIKITHFALYILLPVFVFCDAQAQDIDTLYHINESRDTTGLYYVFERGELPRDAAAKLIVTLMFTYEAECYNDSTYVEYYQHNPPPMSDDGTCVLSIYIPPTLIKEWQHKEPTFKDFVRWVRKKYCR
jgi:hypothetical protein